MAIIDKATIEDAFMLFVAQGAEYLVPLLAIPYLIRTLGAEGYGQIAYVQAIGVYFIILVEYGFGWTATRKLSIAYKKNEKEVSNIFWNVTAARVLLLSVATIGWFVVYILTNTGVVNSRVILIGFVAVIGSALYPAWFMQGVGRIKEAAKISLLVRLVALVLLLCMVTKKEDLEITILIQASTSFAAAIIAWMVLAKNGFLKKPRICISAIADEIKQSWSAFFANASSSIYRSSNPVVLGAMVGPKAVTYYVLGEKLVKAAQELSRPIVQATYPMVSACADKSLAEAVRLLRVILLVVGAMCALLAVGLFVFSEHIIILLTGENVVQARNVLRVMALATLIGGLNSVLGVQTMHGLGFSKQFSRFVLLSGGVSLILILPLTYYLSQMGAAIAYVSSEATLLMLLVLFHVSNKLVISFR